MRVNFCSYRKISHCRSFIKLTKPPEPPWIHLPWPASCVIHVLTVLRTWHAYTEVDLGRGCRGFTPLPPPPMKPSSYSLLKFVCFTSQLCQSLVVHDLVRKISNLPLHCSSCLSSSICRALHCCCIHTCHEVEFH